MTTPASGYQKYLPYIVAFVLFALLGMAYFAPQFSGKRIPMHDVTQYEGMSKEIRDHQQEFGEDPQWTGSMFGGMPAQLINMKYDDSVILQPLLEKVFGFMGRPASFIFIAMVAFFVMLLLFGVNPWVGIIPSLAYGLSTYFFLIIGAGHITKMLALAYAPLMLGGMAYTFRGNIWLGGALTAFFASLEIACNHPQITYYFLFVMLAFWISEGVNAYRKKAMARFAKLTGVLVVAGILAVGSNLAPLWYINDYGKASMRGGTELTETGASGSDSGLDLDYATSWSYGKMESFNMFIPDFTGGASDRGFSPDGKVAEALQPYGARNVATHLPAYWGTQPVTGGPTYLGAVAIFLFVLGMFLLCGPKKWWVLAVSLLALFLGWGRNFMWFTELFFNYFPGYNKFRTVAMILVIVQWSVPFLGALVLNKIWKCKLTKDKIVTGLKRSVYVCGGVALFFLFFGGMIFDFSGLYDGQMGLPPEVISAMQAERASMMRLDSLRSLIFVLAAAGVIWLFATEKIEKWALISLLAVLVCADMIPVNMRFLPQSKFVDSSRTEIKPTAADMEILADTTSGYRVFNVTVNPFNDATTSYFHRSVGGYHGAKMQRYQDLIDRYLAKSDTEILNMLNTRYVIVPDAVTGEPTVEYNAYANGAAWFVDEVVMVDTPDQELAELSYIDTRYEAVVNREFSGYLEGFNPALEIDTEIRMTHYRANYQRYEYYSEAPVMAVFSEIYYKGWQAYLDDEPVPHFRADYVLRAMMVPAGKHVIEFRYGAQNFRTVSVITLVFSILIILSLAAAVTVTMFKRKKDAENAER